MGAMTAPKSCEGLWILVRVPMSIFPMAGPDPDLRSPAGRLDSWKEIAEYLKRSDRTVRRWEAEEGLPVHRHHHRSSGSVHAFKSDLDAWFAGRLTELEPELSEPLQLP